MEKQTSLSSTEDEFASFILPPGTGSKKSSGKCRSVFINCSNDDDEKKHICSAECLAKYPIHHAARLGDFQELKRILDDENCPKCPLQPDECLGRTPLHYACNTGNVEKGLVCVKLLLECRTITENPYYTAKKIKAYVNHLDHLRKSALHLAAKNEATQIVIELLTNQANFDISSIDGTCALREIYKNTPIAMEEALNQSISYVEQCSRPTLPSDNVSSHNVFDFTHTCVNVCLDFYPVIGSKVTSSECQAYQNPPKNADKNKIKLRPETAFLFTVNRKRMETNVRRKILTNALVQAFLHFKWQKIKWFCFVAIFFHTLWLSLYIGTVINVFVLRCPYDTAINDSDADPKLNEILVPCELDVGTQMIAGLLLVLSITVSCKEFFQFCRLKTLYIRFENLGQCILLGFIFCTIPDIYLKQNILISSTHFQIAAFGIFLAWTLLLSQLAKLPQIRLRLRFMSHRGMIVLPDHGIYVEILSRVFKNFLIFISIFSSLLLSFVFSFNILLPNSTGFIKLSNAGVKVLTMMTGELNYDEIFHSSDTQLVYPVAAHLMYALFIMVATIILFNLLIGFTVSDIQGLQKDAEVNQISNKLEQIFLMECFLLSGVMQSLLSLIGKLTFSSDLLSKIMVVKVASSNSLCFHTRIKVLPYNLRVKIRDHASRNCMALSDFSGTARLTLRHFEH